MGDALLALDGTHCVVDSIRADTSKHPPEKRLDFERRRVWLPLLRRAHVRVVYQGDAMMA